MAVQGRTHRPGLLVLVTGDTHITGPDLAGARGRCSVQEQTEEEPQVSNQEAFMEEESGQ